MPRIRKLLVIVLVAFVVIVIFVPPVNDTAPLGGRARDIVKLSLYGSIHIEYDYAGTRPSNAELTAFDTFAEKYTGKLVSIELTAVSGYTQSSYSVEEAITISESQRNTHTFVGVLAIHVFHLNGRLTSTRPGYETGGFAYDATSIVLSSAADPVLRILLAHEFGHLMGLCGISMPDPAGVCDDAGHAKDPTSLMAAVIDLKSPWVQQLELMPKEVTLLGSV